MTLVLLAALLGCLGGPAGARGATGPQILDDLNQMRAANGLQGAIAEDPERSHGCALHTRYMALNRTLAHTEDPRLPGYTALGARAASRSVLTGGGPWSAGITFRQAPIHLCRELGARDPRAPARTAGARCRGSAHRCPPPPRTGAWPCAAPAAARSSGCFAAPGGSAS